MRPAGPGDGLRRRLDPVPREQAGRSRQVPRTPHQDVDEPLHPLHPMHPIHHRGGRGRGPRRPVARRGHGDHELSRAGARVRTPVQCRRPVPGGCPDPQARGLPLSSVGAVQDGFDRRDGRGRLRHPGRFPRPRGHADPAPHQRGGERGMDHRQGPPHRGRPAPAASRSPVRARERPPARRIVAGGLRRDRRPREGCRARPDRRHCGRPRERRGHVCAEAADAEPRRHRTSTHARTARSRPRPMVGPPISSTRPSPASRTRTRS